MCYVVVIKGSQPPVVAFAGGHPCYTQRIAEGVALSANVAAKNLGIQTRYEAAQR